MGDCTLHNRSNKDSRDEKNTAASRPAQANSLPQILQQELANQLYMMLFFGTKLRFDSADNLFGSIDPEDILIGYAQGFLINRQDSWATFYLLTIAKAINTILDSISHNPYESEALVTQAHSMVPENPQIKEALKNLLTYNRTMLEEVFNWVAPIQAQNTIITEWARTQPHILRAFQRLHEEVIRSSKRVELEDRTKPIHTTIKGHSSKPGLTNPIFNNWMNNFAKICTPAKQESATVVPRVVAPATTEAAPANIPAALPVQQKEPSLMQRIKALLGF